MDDRAGPLGFVSPDGQYEVAWVAPIGGVARDIIEDIRKKSSIPRPREHQLRPHLTILFLGALPASSLAEVLPALEASAGDVPGFCLEEWGAFTIDGRVVNLHLRASPRAPLVALHRRAFGVARNLGWSNPSEFTGDRYVPHVSVFDRVDLDAAPSFPPVSLSAPPTQAVSFGRRLRRSD